MKDENAKYFISCNYLNLHDYAFSCTHDVKPIDSYEILRCNAPHLKYTIKNTLFSNLP